MPRAAVACSFWAKLEMLVAWIASVVPDFCALGKFDGGAVGEHFGHALGDLGGGKAHVEDGIGSHRLGLGDHAVGGLVPGFLQHLGVAGDFSSDDGFEPGHEVASDVFGAHGIAADDAEMGSDLAAGNGFGSGGDHDGDRLAGFY